jgi:spore maturation protein CgeB
LGYLAPVGKYRRPRNIRAVSREPVYGRDLYALISKARIVLNGTIDMSGEDRGNMRCFEAMGCRALMVSDSGRYPDGMESGVTMKTYDNCADAVSIIKASLDDYDHAHHIVTNAYNMTRNLYSKAAQWTEFQKLVSTA